MTELRLNKEIYSKEKLDETIRIFDGYGTIRATNNSREFVVVFKNCKFDENKTVMEFENYLICLENR